MSLSSAPTVQSSRWFRLWPWLAAAASGVLLALCFPPYNQGWLVWLALIPLLCALWFSPEGRRPQLRAALLGYVTGIVFFTLVFIWLSTLAKLFQSPALLGLPPLLSLILGLYIAAWAWFVARLQRRDPASSALPASAFLSSRRNLLTGVLAASAWVVQEWVRGWLFSGFGWNGLGVALHRNLAMIQAADIAGVLGLSGLVAFCNVMTVVIIRRLCVEIGPQFLKCLRWEFSVTMAIVVGVSEYGAHAVLKPPATDRVDLKVAMVQPNLPQNEKWDPDMEDQLFKHLDILTRAAALSKPDLIIWPESATPRGIYADEYNEQFIMQEAALGNFALLIGTLLPDEAMQGEFNGAALLTAGGKERQYYRKIHLVPYGEYLPMRPILGPIAGNLVPGDFMRGRDYTVFSLPSPAVTLAPLICFEDTLGDLTRHFVAKGADALVNLTNDGWFLQSPAAEQQLANALFRAVENRRPLLRCTNTGITCTVDPLGRIDRWAAPFREEVPFSHLVPIPRHAPLSIYTRYGDWIAYVACAVVCVSLGCSVLRGRKR